MWCPQTSFQPCLFPIAGKRTPGTSHLPGEARAALELNTAIHAIARGRETSSSSSVPSPASGAADSRQDLGVYQPVEPLTLEVCLLDNGRRSSSPLAPPSSSALLGVGTMALTPIIVSSMHEGEHRGNSRREVLLFEPGSGKNVASVLLGIEFSSHHSNYSAPTESPRIADAANTYSERLAKVRKVVWGEVDACPV